MKEVTVKKGWHIGSGFLKEGATYKTIPFSDGTVLVGNQVVIHVPGLNQHNKAYCSVTRFEEFSTGE